MTTSSDLPGRDWYYIRRSEEGRTKYSIVHKRQWHYHHALDDWHISDFLHLPKEFEEIEESTFSYRGYRRRGEQVLQQQGFTNINNPFWWNNGACIFYVPPSQREIRLDYTCDTPELALLIEKWSEKNVPQLIKPDGIFTKRSYSLAFKKFAVQKDFFTEMMTCERTTREGIWLGGKLCIMELTVARNLPPFPRSNEKSFM